jgi:diguanylate cyclase (GGDEF)-like protein
LITDLGADAAGVRGQAAPPSMPPYAPATTRPRKLSWLLVSQLVLGLLVAMITFLFALQSRQQAITQAEHEMQSLSLTLADQAERAFEAVDLVQAMFTEIASAEQIQTPDEFRRRLSSQEFNHQLIAHGGALPQLDTLGIVDPDGALINLNRPWPLPTQPVNERPYFKVLKADPFLRRFISDPFQNYWDHAGTVVVARSVTTAEGRLLGISFAGVIMPYFENLYKTVTNNNADLAISLFSSAGVLMARFPRIDGTVGKIFPDAVFSNDPAAYGLESEVSLKTSLVDGVDRIIAKRKLAQFPMLVAVSMKVSAILKPWRQQTCILIGAASILEIAVVAVGMLMQRQLRAQSLLSEARSARLEAEAAQRSAQAELALGRERERADRELHIQALHFGAALGNMSEVLCLFDSSDRMVVGNDRLCEILALPGGSITPGTSIEEVAAKLAAAADGTQDDPQKILALIRRLREAGQRASQALDTETGGRVAVNFAPMQNGGWLVTLEDITAQRLSAARIEHMAHHDALTGLPNRVLFHERLNEAILRCRRGERCAALYLDLDNFKTVNDTLGHPVGDALLQQVTARLKQQVRELDTVARLGGDEFAILMVGISQPADSTLLAARVIEAISQPFDLNGNRVIIGTSIGISVIPEDGEDADEIIKKADMALYRSKADGRGRYEFFEPEMDARMRARRTLDLDLRRALAEDEFKVFYQPVMEIATQSVCGFEALVRWRHPQRGMVSPADFIPLAEETRLIIPLGQWVLRRACADAATWPDNLKVAVNLSPVQFRSPTLVDDVAAALIDAALPAWRLELEITETAMLADTDAVLQTLHRLRDLGLRIALDDFGTGYSSLSYLQGFPFRKVKIDRSFVARLGQGDNNDTIVAAVIDLCGRLGMVTTAEGVETTAQLAHLAELRCTEAQGYLFSRPRPADDVVEMLQRLAPAAIATTA